MISSNDKAGHYAVIFTSKKGDDLEGYGDMAAQMVDLASQQPGFVGIESFGEPPFGTTISYWESREAIAAWGRNADHRLAQQAGHGRFYETFALRICRIEDVRRK